MDNHPTDNQPADIQFQGWLMRSLARQLRLFLSVAIGASVMSMLAHMAIFPSRIWPASLGFIGGFILLPLLVALFLTRYKFSEVTVQRISTTICLLALTGVNGLVLWCNVNGFDMPYEGVLVITICVGLFSTLRWSRVMIITGISFLTFTIGKFSLSLDPITLTLIQAFFVAFFSAMATLLAYLMARLLKAEYRHQESLKQLSETDPLTGLLNRRGFEQRYDLALRTSLRSGKPIGLLLVDVDHFKLYNDHYGHDSGDDALVAIADALKGFARRPLDASARLGGEEFCLLLHEADPDILRKVGQRLCDSIRALAIDHARSDVTDVVTVSIGITDVPPGASFQQAYRRADHALYSAKSAGRNRFVWTPAAPELTTTSTDEPEAQRQTAD